MLLCECNTAEYVCGQASVVSIWIDDCVQTKHEKEKEENENYRHKWCRHDD